MAAVTVDRGVPEQPAGRVEERRGGLRVPLRAWVIGGLIGAIVLITATGELTVRCEGRRLPDRFDDAHAMRAAFARAPWETLEFELLP